MVERLRNGSTKMKLTQYLRALYEIQDRIILVYRPTEKSGWKDRCFYLDDEFVSTKAYNHRVILQKEVVIEFDEEKQEDNEKYAREVCQRLKKDNIPYSLWYSGNKSCHVHCLIDVKEAKALDSLKNAFMRHYTQGMPLPDMRLAANNHLIRAEFGIHEKTGKQKILLAKTPGYGKTLGEIRHEIWNAYVTKQRQAFARRLTDTNSTLADHPGFKWILTAEKFRDAADGHERALFMLIHVLKPDYKDRQEDLIKFLAGWYRYSSGNKLTEQQIAQKVRYHWTKTYNFTEKYLHELLECLGHPELIRK